MGRDLKLDPVTGDYIPDGSGGYETTYDASTAIMHQISGHLGKWIGDPERGSRFYQLARAKSSIRSVAVLRDITRAALKPLVEAGLISEPEIAIERDVDTQRMQATCTDLQSGQVVDFSDLIPLEI